VDSQQPYGTREAVAIGSLRLPGAGKGLFGARARKNNPLLFKRAHEFVCVYATMADVISVTEAQVSDSEYIWTNCKKIQLEWDSEALYFDALLNLLYEKYANDSWSEEGNCMIKWNPTIRRVEIWSLVDIPLYKELGVAYNDPYWYRRANGLRILSQALQVKEYHNKGYLPPYADSSNQDIAMRRGPSTPPGHAI
jgi:hypothetical protein